MDSTLQTVKRLARESDLAHVIRTVAIYAAQVRSSARAAGARRETDVLVRVLQHLDDAAELAEQLPS